MEKKFFYNIWAVLLMKFWCLSIPIIKAFELLKLENIDDECKVTASLHLIGSI
jgi:hypothetical protein